MINGKRLVAIARKWQKLASVGRRRISMSGTNVSADWGACEKSVPHKGHFIVYTTDARRFAISLAYHNSPIFQLLFKLSEDEFGLPSEGPITMPCDAVYMNYIVLLLQKTMPKDVERALLMSMPTGGCSTLSCLHQLHTNQLISVYGY